jgi:IMP cyclohydrolase
MKNPNGPYPGRQLFLGLTVDHRPCFAYFVSGRSPESRQRKAIVVENTVRIGPVGNQPYDPLRHYSAVIQDRASGVLAVSNGIQTEAIYEMYRLLFNTRSAAGPDYLEKILEGAGSEPDSYHTPRIAGYIAGTIEKPAVVLAMKAYDQPALATSVELQAGNLTGISTYGGDLDNPLARRVGDLLPRLEFKWHSAEELARYIFDLSAAIYNGNDIRVCSVGGVRSAQGWEIALWNAY